MKHYEKEYTNNIAFPLGGIGAGSISLSGNGSFVDPEINHHPNLEAECSFTSFAVKAEADGKLLDSRLLCGDSIRDLAGTIHNNYGCGSTGLSGFRHFESVSFDSAFPIANLHFKDPSFPADISLEAFNPFIPSNDKDSSLPAAFFQLTLTNTAEIPVTFRVLFSVSNLLESCGKNIWQESARLKKITLNGSSAQRDDLSYGNLTAATDASDTSHQDYWFRGPWFDTTTMFRNLLSTPGTPKNRIYETPRTDGGKDTATLCASVLLAPKARHTFRFLLSWYVPNARGYWHPDEGFLYRTYYSALFENSDEVAEYCFANWDRLYQETKLFTDTLYASSLPAEVLDAVGSNLAILKSSTCLRLEDGSFWGWEGVLRQKGSCMGTCHHVWNYAYAMPFLFPKLEQKLRQNELDYCLEKDGMMHFRMPVDRSKRWGERACVDGQMGFILKYYREWKLSGDNDQLRKDWPNIQNCLAYAWSPDNFDHWDPNQSGVLSGRQHHTLDVELFGTHAWLTGFYHAALLAAAEMAEFLGDTISAQQYRAIFHSGQKALDEETFNGSYYMQKADLKDRNLLRNLVQTDEDFDFYWDEESGQMKYQLGTGCEIDQVLADWHAGLIGLPAIFNPEHRKSALLSIYRYNFLPMHDLINPCRVFACNNEKGTVMCRWPEEASKPAIPVPYSEECMSGFEYAFAAGLLQCGLEEQALEVVHAIRERYDGLRRNPFAELECGASYARAMASYSLLLIYSGFTFDLPHQQIGFIPLKPGRYFWSADGAWGSVCCSDTRLELTLLYGSLSFCTLKTALSQINSVTLNGQPIYFQAENGTVSGSFQMTSAPCVLTVTADI